MGRCGHHGTKSLCAGFEICALVVSRSVRVSGAQIIARSRAMQGPSPDEVALVEAARRLGCEFMARSRTHITLRLHGEEARQWKAWVSCLICPCGQ